jgi:hypothetical protein
MDPILTVPATATVALLAYAGQLFTDLWALIAIAIGVPLGFYIINRAIGTAKSGVKAK